VEGVRGWPPDFVRLVRQRTDLVALVGERVALRPVGRELVGLCPFHPEKTPSFSVSPEKQLFHCHGCHAGGDAITFLMRIDGLDFAQAVAELAHRAGLPLPEGGALSAEGRRRYEEREALYRTLAAAAEFYAHVLRTPVGQPAVAYLRQRGVDAPTAERFGLGYAPPDGQALLHALGRRVPPERLLQAGLVAERPEGGFYDRFRGRLMFPIWDERGRVVAFGGRALGQDGGPKYLNSPETPIFAKRRTLYALHLARPAAARAGRLLVVEGYMDVLTCHQFGFTETVATLGTALSDAQAGMLSRASECIVLAYDADPAGDAATERGLALLQQAGARVEVVRLPAGQDPDDLLRREGRARFEAVLATAEPLVQYLVRSAVGPEGAERLSPERRRAVARRVAPFLAAFPVGLRQEYVEWIARELWLRPEEVWPGPRAAAGRGREHRNSSQWNPRAARPSAAADAVAPKGVHAAEEMVLAALLRSEGLLRRLAATVSIHDFRDPAHRAVAALLLDGPGGSRAVVPGPMPGEEGTFGPPPRSDGEGRATAPEAPGARLLDTVTDPELRMRIAALLGRELPGDPEALVPSCLETLRRAALEAEIARLRAEQRRLAREGKGVDAPEARAVAAAIRDAVARMMQSKAGHPRVPMAQELDG
jgi:DNA primase